MANDRNKDSSSSSRRGSQGDPGISGNSGMSGAGSGYGDENLRSGNMSDSSETRESNTSSERSGSRSG
ncbi:MAG TPA: hypothetical protein VGC52_09065, partial [Gemmatimonadaceae bacterium]